MLMQKLSAATHTETNGPAEPLVTAGYAEWEVRRFSWFAAMRVGAHCPHFDPAVICVSDHENDRPLWVVGPFRFD